MSALLIYAILSAIVWSVLYGFAMRDVESGTGLLAFITFSMAATAVSIIVWHFYPST